MSSFSTSLVGANVVGGVHQGFEEGIFGDGSDGDLLVPGGGTTLTRIAYYRNLTLDSASGLLLPNGYPIYVSDTLDVSTALGGAILVVGNNGANGVLAVGGAVTPATYASAVLPGGELGGAGQNGGTGVGAAAVAIDPAAANTYAGGLGGAGGAGGAGGSGAGGANDTPTAITNAYDLRTLWQQAIRFSSATAGFYLRGGIGSAGGGSGAGDGVNAGGGGGAGGSPGAVLFIFARRIRRSSAGNAQVISAAGGNGGNGGFGPAGNTGGGGAGGGGPGGWIYIVYQELVGTRQVALIVGSGGNGGTGGSPAGTGVSGTGAAGGQSGRVVILNIATGRVTEPAMVGGSPPVGVNGGLGGSLLVDL